jgi:transcriptional regulator with XRE-family HTH domain
MLDLQTLGGELRRRRRALRIPSAELARRIGISQTYIWLIEKAKPRTSGEPSRPSEDLLRRWTAVLGMGEAEARGIYELAGYFDSDVLREHRESRPVTPRAERSPASSVSASSRRDFAGGESRRSSSAQRLDLSPALSALDRWAGAEHAGIDEESLIRRVQLILQLAQRNGRSEEAAFLLHSFLRWLEFHLEEES